MINEDGLKALLYCLISGMEDAKGFNEEEAEEMRNLIEKTFKEI